MTPISDFFNDDRTWVGEDQERDSYVNKHYPLPTEGEGNG